MLDVKPYLFPSNFPMLRRGKLESLQVNLGYLCNLSCTHCHVAAGPSRTELMALEDVELVIALLRQGKISQLDLTGGAPEMNPHFRYLVTEARKLGVEVIDRCNLVILEEEGYDDLADFLAQHQIVITASLPCYQQDNVDQQRGRGVYDLSIKALKRLNELGYGLSGSGLALNLVYNPGGPHLPPNQQQLELDYKEKLFDEHGIEFNELYTITNMPISRFGSMLLSKKLFNDYMQLLKENFSSANLQNVMCTSLISVDWQGFVYDCDFNQMLDMRKDKSQLLENDVFISDRSMHLCDILQNIDGMQGSVIEVGEHCYGCTAGQGSGCGGAL